MCGRYIYFLREPISNENSVFIFYQKMAGLESRMVIASQIYEPKGWKDENGREKCWKSLGGAAAEWADPINEAKWFDKDNVHDTLIGNYRNLRRCLFRRGRAVLVVAGWRGWRWVQGVDSGAGEGGGLSINGGIYQGGGRS